MFPFMLMRKKKIGKILVKFQSNLGIVLENWSFLKSLGSISILPFPF